MSNSNTPSSDCEEVKSSGKIIVTLNDGNQIEVTSFKTSPFEIVCNTSKEFSERAIAAKVDGNLWDLKRPLENNCTLDFIFVDSDEGKKVLWSSAIHLLGNALHRIYGGQLVFGQILTGEHGFLCDVRFPQQLNFKMNLDVVYSVMEEITNQQLPFERMEVSKEEVLELFKHNTYKADILKTKNLSHYTVYRCGSFIDACKGPLAPHSGFVKAFHIYKRASKYWKNNAENDLLRRFYGISFSDPQQLQEWKRTQLARTITHQYVGKTQELFFFLPGLQRNIAHGAFFSIYGTRIFNKLLEVLRRECRHSGFDEIITPTVFKNDLWLHSRSFYYRDSDYMKFKYGCEDYSAKNRNEDTYCFVFRHRMRSYRELPMRLVQFGTIQHGQLRNWGSLHNTQQRLSADGMIFCEADQVKNEFRRHLDLAKKLYQHFGIQLSLRLGPRPTNYFGESSTWEKLEKDITDTLDLFKIDTGISWNWDEDPGPFDGLCVQFMLKLAGGRSYKMGYIKVHLQLPIRFDIEYMDRKEGFQRPICIFASIVSSVEYLFAVLCEHYGGKWPFWIAPVGQVVVIPVNRKSFDYAQHIATQLTEEGFYVNADLSRKWFNKKLSSAHRKGCNLIVVVGDKELKTGTVNIRSVRDESLHLNGKQLTIAEIIAELKLLLPFK